MKKFFPSFVFLCMLVLVGLFPTGSRASIQTLNITATKGNASPSTITVAEGDTVNLSITASDDKYTFAIAGYGINETINKGKSAEIGFVAKQSASFVLTCATCGKSASAGTLAVEGSTDNNSNTNSTNSQNSNANTNNQTDTTAPTISGITVAESESGTATISWSSDEAAFGQVEYGAKTGSYTSATALETQATKSHTASLSGLTADTTYYYRVKSKDETGNLAHSSEATFTTKEENKTCDDLTCEEGETCKLVDSEPQCVADEEIDAKTCDDLTCEEGESCKIVEDQAKCVADDEEAKESETGKVIISSIKTDQGTYTANDSNITLTSGSQITITGTAESDSEISLEFCCATTRYTVYAQKNGDWSFQGMPPLDAGNNTIKISEKGSNAPAINIKFTMVDQADSNTNNNQSVTGAADANKHGGWVVPVIIVGLLIVVFSGVMFVRQVRR